jgi:hypothetical protein
MGDDVVELVPSQSNVYRSFLSLMKRLWPPATPRCTESMSTSAAIVCDRPLIAVCLCLEDQYGRVRVATLNETAAYSARSRSWHSWDPTRPLTSPR